MSLTYIKNKEIFPVFHAAGLWGKPQSTLTRHPSRNIRRERILERKCAAFTAASASSLASAEVFTPRWARLCVCAPNFTCAIQYASAHFSRLLRNHFSITQTLSRLVLFVCGGGFFMFGFSVCGGMVLEGLE